MTIQIDDAGWGSLVGGVIIGACRVESHQTQHGFKEVPVSFFQGEAFDRKLYLEHAAEIAKELMEELHVALDEPVQVCTGYVLQAVRSGLAEAGYQVAPVKIGEPLQTLIEQELLDRVLALGVETDLETLTEKQGLYFWQCIRWVKGGDVDRIGGIPERMIHCKSGWGTFDIWINHPYQKAKRLSKAYKANKRRERLNNKSR